MRRCVITQTDLSHIIVEKLKIDLWCIEDLDNDYKVLVSYREGYCIKWIKKPQNSCQYLNDILKAVKLY